MIVTLPWPSSKLSPNARVHWSTKAKAVKVARRGAWAYGIVQGFQELRGSPGLHVTTTYHPPDKRRYDLDNLEARMKAYRDGLADACQVDDSLWTLGAPILGEVRKGGCVVVEMIAKP